MQSGLGPASPRAAAGPGKSVCRSSVWRPCSRNRPPPLPLLCRTQLVPLFPAGWGRGAPAAARDTPPRQRVPMQSRPLQEKSESEESEAKPPSELLPGGPRPAVVAKATSEAKAETNLQLSAAKRLSKQPRHESALWANRVAAPCTAQPGAPESGTRKDSQTKSKNKIRLIRAPPTRPALCPQAAAGRENLRDSQRKSGKSLRTSRGSQGAVRSEGRCLLLGALTKHF